MTHTRRLTVFAFPILILLSLIILTFSPFFTQSPGRLSQAIILDLIVTLPIAYLISIWKTSIPKYTFLSCIVIGTIVASIIIPTEHQGFFIPLKSILVPAVELSILGLILYKVVTIRKKMGAEELSNLGFYDKILHVTQEIFPSRLSYVLSTEIAVPYFIFIKKNNTPLKENEFSYYKKSGITTIIYVMMLLALAELSVVHLLLERYNTTLAWVASGLTLYSLLQIIALVRSLPHRNHFLDVGKKSLSLKYGFFSHGTLPTDNIKKVIITRKQLPEDKLNKTFSPLAILDSHNVVLELKEPWTFIGFYGKKITCQKLALYIDEKEEFNNKVTALITE